MADTIIQLNKTKLLKQGTSVAAGIDTITFASEADAIRLFGYVPQIANGSFWWELYELGGSAASHERLIHRSPTYTKIIPPQTFTVVAGQLLKLRIHHSGVVSYSVYATGISGSVAQWEEGKTLASTVQDDKVYQTQTLELLKNMQTTLSQMLNHMRLMTDVNGDKEDDY